MTNLVKNVLFTTSELRAVAGRLETLMQEVNHGVDVWLAPGGVLDVTSETHSEDTCFVDFDDPDVDHLNSVVAKMNAELDDSESVTDFGNAEALENPTYIWAVFQRSEHKPVEEMPITGVYSTPEKALQAVTDYLNGTEGVILEPAHSDENETIWSIQGGAAECVLARLVLDH